MIDAVLLWPLFVRTAALSLTPGDTHVLPEKKLSRDAERARQTQPTAANVRLQWLHLYKFWPCCSVPIVQKLKKAIQLKALLF